MDFKCACTILFLFFLRYKKEEDKIISICVSDKNTANSN